jgi:hypothetical protein
VKTAGTSKARRTIGKHGRPARKPAAKPTLYEQLKVFDGRANDLPVDLALQHDHYLYSTAKRARQ